MRDKAIIDKITEAVKNYNGQIARWKSQSYRGAIPTELLEAIVTLSIETERFAKKLVKDPE